MVMAATPKAARATHATQAATAAMAMPPTTRMTIFRPPGLSGPA
ncbi:hypothetical protein OG979_27150 [Actinomadura citrea]|nr:hypothetical protein [Actinomadura citrea]